MSIKANTTYTFSHCKDWSHWNKFHWMQTQSHHNQNWNHLMNLFPVNRLCLLNHIQLIWLQNQYFPSGFRVLFQEPFVLNSLCFTEVSHSFLYLYLFDSCSRKTVSNSISTGIKGSWSDEYQRPKNKYSTTFKVWELFTCWMVKTLSNRSLECYVSHILTLILTLCWFIKHSTSFLLNDIQN